MVPIPGGTFLMGSNQPLPSKEETGLNHDTVSWAPAHSVTLSPYCIDLMEVSVRRYKKCVEEKKCKPPGVFSGEENDHTWPNKLDYPINVVSYKQAQEFCEHQGGKLPSEAQWEFAARGTDGREYPFSFPSNSLISCKDSLAGKSATPLVAAFHEGSACHKGNGGLWPVGSAPAGASPFGVLDMAGSVMEWVEDALDPSFYAKSPTLNPRNPKSGAAEGIVRGGGWSTGGGDPNKAPAWQMKTYFREPQQRDARDAEIGFRCVSEPLP
jgi:formylglycine-generating enzyme required for sulfatase activity